MWLPVTEFIDGEVYFLESDPYYTLTNPANTQSPVVVSYYNGTTNAVSQTSGRGYTRSGQIKPDLTAPGINHTRSCFQRTIEHIPAPAQPVPSLPALWR